MGEFKNEVNEVLPERRQSKFTLCEDYQLYVTQFILKNSFNDTDPKLY
jgi:hypothetical protein